MILEILQFTFSSFWVWAGTVVLVAAASGALRRLLVGIRSLFN